MNQLIVNLENLSPGLINDLKKSIADTLMQNVKEINLDWNIHWDHIENDNTAKVQMIAWRDAAHKELVNFTKEYPR